MNKNQNSRRLKAAIIVKYGSQENFAEKMKLDPAYVSRVVNGRKILSGSDKLLWSRKLSRPLGELFSV